MHCAGCWCCCRTQAQVPLRRLLWKSAGTHWSWHAGSHGFRTTGRFRDWLNQEKVATAATRCWVWYPLCPGCNSYSPLLSLRVQPIPTLVDPRIPTCPWRRTRRRLGVKPSARLSCSWREPRWEPEGQRSMLYFKFTFNSWEAVCKQLTHVKMKSFIAPRGICFAQTAQNSTKNINNHL